jgi:hypothetical protein
MVARHNKSFPTLKKEVRKINLARDGPKPSPGAVHMARLCERKTRGTIFVAFEMTPAAVDRLEALKWLNPEKRNNRAAGDEAFLAFGTAAGTRKKRF